MSSQTDKPVNRDELEILLGRLENKIDARFNTLEAKINNTRYLMVAIIASAIVQIVNAWVLHH